MWFCHFLFSFVMRKQIEKMESGKNGCERITTKAKYNQ